MSSCTDLLRLNEKRLFKDIRASLSCGAKETRNILEVRDNVLYAWNADKCCVLTFNVAATRGKLGDDVPYQVSTPNCRLTKDVFSFTSKYVSRHSLYVNTQRIVCRAV
ncbi:hypothetical protein EAG_13345 [Camponotus floridanus]|uniref:Uncharacterized protein n=1 Tax=Camponotus floridanus TaxID=104421 RepID=E2A5P1_CAMFO|nr:hypothetical protein EAG_13345 [Camponotus floridanus]